MIEITFSHRERELMLEYGYPFEGIQLALEKLRSTRANRKVVASIMEWEQMVGNLSITINEDVDDESLVYELDIIADHIELELRRMDRK